MSIPLAAAAVAFTLLWHATTLAAAQRTPWVVSVQTNLPSATLLAPNYVGLSIEWNYLDGFTNNSDFTSLMAMVSGGSNGSLSIRVGGNSQDNITTLATPYFWNKLALLANATGCQYIVGLNLKVYNVSFAVLQTQNAIKYLPAGSIYGFEIGNEPDRYQYLGWRPANYITSAQYKTELTAYLEALAPVWYSGFGTLQMLVGPSFSVSLAWTTNQMKAYVSSFLTLGYLKVVSTHKYITSADTVRANVTTLSLNDVVVQYAKDISALRGVAKTYKLPFRVSEMASFSQGGVEFVSDSMAAALWSLDEALYMAEQGTGGVNFHGGGSAFYSAISQYGFPQDLSLTVSPVYYSLLMLQNALTGVATFVPSAITVSGPPAPLNTVSTYTLMDTTTGIMRAVIINKNMVGASLSVNVQLTGSFSSGQGVYLIGDSMYADVGTTYAGQSVLNNGSVTGEFLASYPAPSLLAPVGLPAAVQMLVSRNLAAVKATAAYTTQYTVIVPPAAALMLIAMP